MRRERATWTKKNDCQGVPGAWNHCHSNFPTMSSKKGGGHYCNFLGPSYTGLKKTTMEHKMNGSVGVSFGTMALAGIFMFPAVQGFGDNAIKVGNQKICVLWRENVGAEPCCKTRQGPHPKRYSSNPSDSDSDRGRPMGSVWNFFPRKKRSKKKRRIFSQKKNRPNTR